MKPPILSIDEIRECERKVVEDLGIPSYLLMENAGRGLADHINSLLSRFPRTTQVIFLCGSGNNGGDGFVAARHLSQKHAVVSIYLMDSTENLKGDALLNFKILSKLDIPIYPFSDFAKHRLNQFQNSALVIIDAMVGTGLKGPVRPEIASAIAQVIDLKKFHNAKVNVVAVDIPTGLNGDTGAFPNSAVMPAELTVTFGFPKKCFFDLTAKSYMGRLELVDIGIPSQFMKTLGNC